MSEEMRSYYFGCYRQLGHHFYDRFLTKPRGVDAIVPWGYGVDGKLCPPREIQGKAAVHHRDGWTALAFWDSTVDDRPGSNSVFLFEALLTFSEALAMADELYPRIIARFPFPILPVSSSAVSAPENKEGT